MSDPWLILGAGSIGALWGIRLHQAGKTPTLLLRPEALGRYEGLTLSGEGKFCLPAVSAETIDHPISRLLVCCKSHQTLSALSDIAPHLAPNATVVVVQNGMGVAEQLQKQYPQWQLFSGTTTNGAHRSAPFTITPAGRGDTLIGSLTGNFRQAETLAESLSCPGFPVNACSDITEALWQKLAINCAINPLTVRYRCRNGELLSNPAAYRDLQQVCEEFFQLSVALGRESWVENLLDTVTEVACKTAANRSSMLQDVEAGRATEIEAITGYVCGIAADAGIDIPVNQTLYQDIRQLHPATR